MKIGIQNIKSHKTTVTMTTTTTATATTTKKHYKNPTANTKTKETKKNPSRNVNDAPIWFGIIS
jgi:hypothetical protein